MIPTIRGREGSITERRIGFVRQGLIQFVDGGTEPGLAAVELCIIANATGAHQRTTTLATLSLHALACRYQRGRDTSDAALLREIALLSRNASMLPEGGGGLKVPTNRDGGWRGRIVPYQETDGTFSRVILALTWLSS